MNKLEVEIYKLLAKQHAIKLKVLVFALIDKGYKKLDIYNTIKWKLSNPIPHPEDDDVWAAPMVKVVEKFTDNRLCKFIELRVAWHDVDEKYVEKYFSGSDLTDEFSFW